MRTRSTALFVLLAGSAVTAQTGVLDQASPMTNASYNLSTNFLFWQQQIRAGLSGQLEGIRVTLSGNAGAQATFAVRLGAAWSNAPDAFSTQITKEITGQEVVFIDMTAANIQLSANDLFVLYTFGNDTGMNLIGSYVAPPGTPLYIEPLYLNNSIFVEGWRHGFDTFMLVGGGGCYANCDQSTTQPILNVADFSCFLSKFAAGDPYANCDQSTTEPVLNVADFSCFLSKFAGGCP